MRPFLNLCFAVLTIGVASCSSSEVQSSQNEGVEVVQGDAGVLEQVELLKVEKVFDVSTVKITVSRGAFHYDKFQLIGNELSYIPNKSPIDEGYPQYQIGSEVMLSDSVVESLCNEIIKSEIFEMKERYEEMSTCTSMLKVEISIGNINKTIICTDFDRGCPDALYSFEKKLIELHGKNLKRVLLPG